MGQKKDIQNFEHHIQEDKINLKEIHLTLNEIKWMRLPNWCTDINEDNSDTTWKNKADRIMQRIITMKNIKQTIVKDLKEQLKELASLEKSLWIHKIRTTPQAFTEAKYAKSGWIPPLETIQEETNEIELEETTEIEQEQNTRMTRLQRFLSWMCCFSKH
ncbi:uncharacterized protein ACNLHF_021049 [Anomaloglossus baeobatrachus]